MDGSEVGWLPSSSLFFILYHFRLGHDGVCLAQILWRWVCTNPLCCAGATFFYVHITSMLFSMKCLCHQKMVHYHIVIFPPFLLSLHLSLWHASMRVISISCSFVIISFCSFPQLQLCLFSCAQSHQHRSSLPLNLCITNFYIFYIVLSFCMPLIAAFLSVYLFGLYMQLIAIFLSVYTFGLFMPLISTFLSVYMLWGKDQDQILA